MEISADVLKEYKPVDEDRINALLQAEIKSDNRKIVVLDDDPTGIQTVHDIDVYTDWKKESVLDGFINSGKLFFILTNSRGLTEEETTKVHREIAAVVSEVSAVTGIDYILLSRSDSTLRGHFPLETEVLREEILKRSGKKFDGEILCPFFKEGGQFTINNVHYLIYKQIRGENDPFNSHLFKHLNISVVINSRQGADMYFHVLYNFTQI